MQKGLMISARIASGVLSVFWGLLFFGVIDLAVVFDRTPGFYESYLLETGWGLIYTVLVAAPLIVLAVSPQRTSLTAQIAVVAVCVAVAAVTAFSWRQLLPAAGLLLTAVPIDSERRTSRPERSRPKTLAPPDPYGQC